MSEDGAASRGRMILSAAVASLVLFAGWALFDERVAPTGAVAGELSGMPGPAVAAPHARLESTTLMPTRAPVAVAPARLRVEDEDGGPVAGAIVWAAGDTAAGSHREARVQLATSDRDGIAAPVITAPQTSIAVTAPGYLERALNLGPRADLRVALQRAHELEIVCEDLTRRPLPGVLVAIAPGSMPTDWLETVARQGAVPTRQDDDPYVAITDAAGVARFAALPRDARRGRNVVRVCSRAVGALRRDRFVGHQRVLSSHGQRGPWTQDGLRRGTMAPNCSDVGLGRALISTTDFIPERRS